MIQVGMVWYPDTLEGRRLAAQAQRCKYKAFISERKKKNRIYGGTGAPPITKVIYPKEDKNG